MHVPVMLSEVMRFLDIESNGIYIDSTFGFGGHTREILKYLNKNGKLFIIDKDSFSYKIGKKLSLFDNRINALYMSFDQIYSVSNKYGFWNQINGIVADLGLSFFQFKDISKGFGFDINSFLDMRLNIDQKIRAVDWINFATQGDLEDVFHFLENDFIIKRVVKKIISYRKINYIKTSYDLYNICSGILTVNKENFINQIFQSIRIFINNDLYSLYFFLKSSFRLLKPGGVLLLICFNSLEDKIIKNFLLHDCCNFKIEFIYVRPSSFEVNNNYCSRSASMRIIKKL